jgi:sorbitol-specific phosphotransferase system component IIC
MGQVRYLFIVPGGSDEETPDLPQPARKSFLRAFFQKSASCFLIQNPYNFCRILAESFKPAFHAAAATSAGKTTNDRLFAPAATSLQHILH